MSSRFLFFNPKWSESVHTGQRVVGGRAAGSARVAGVGHRGAGIAARTVNDIFRHDDRRRSDRRGRIRLGRNPRTAACPAAPHRTAADRQAGGHQNQRSEHQDFFHCTFSVCKITVVFGFFSRALSPSVSDSAHVLVRCGSETSLFVLPLPPLSFTRSDTVRSTSEKE